MLITGLNLATLPPLYFFSFFYYTDIVSTCLVLLTYLLHLQHKPWLAATAGTVHNNALYSFLSPYKPVAMGSCNTYKLAILIQDPW